MAETTLIGKKVSWCQPRGPVLSGLDFEVRAGEWISLVGPNGAGKSTLLQILAGTLGFDRSHFSGSIHLLGEDWTRLSQRTRASVVAYLGSELGSLFPITVDEAIASGVFASGDCGRLEWAVEFCGLQPFLGRELGTLSGGERQRVLLARGLAQGARVLLLDETFSKMDLDYQFELGEQLRTLVREGMSVVLVSHDPQMSVRFADRIWLLHQGSWIAQGEPAGVLTEENLRRLYPRSSLHRLFSQK